MANEQIRFEFTAINKTAAAFNSIQKGLGEMASAANLAKGALASVVAMVTSGAFLQFGRQALDAAGGIAELAAQTGASTKALQAYKFIALENGVSNEQMQKGFAQLTKRLGEAKLGSDKMIEAFAAVGISGSQLANLTTDQAMLRISDALSKIEDPAKRAALETQLFGKAGQALDPILTQGSAAIAEQTRKLEELGVIMDDAMIAKADDAADRMAMLEEVVKTKLTIAVAENADAFVTVSNAIAGAISVISPFITLVGNLVGNFDKLIGRMRQMKELTPGNIIKGIGAYATSIYTGNNFDDIYDKTMLTPEQYREKFVKGKPLLPQGMGLKPAMPSVDVPKLFGSRGSGASTKPKKRDVIKDIFNDRDTFMEMMRNDAEEVIAKMGGNKPLIEILPSTDALTKQIAELQQPLRTITTEAKELSDGIAASFGNAFQGLVTGTQGFKSAFKSLADSIISDLMRIYVTEKIVKTIGNFFQSMFSVKGKKAIGGPVQAGQPYIVGERGPELFMPSRSGTIVPNNKMGGSGFVINVDARGASDPAAVRAQVEMGIAQAAPYIIAAAQNKTLKTASRPRLPGTIG